MRRFLVVGCGGSGGSTAAYMIDQLASDLAEHDVVLGDQRQSAGQIPAGWQFVHLDVPAGEEPGPNGLGNVVEQGGRYLGIGPTSGAYAELDHAVSQRLRHNRALDSIGSWAPRAPQKVSTPISVGAGQYRTIGRMITLARADQVRDGLTAAWTEMVSNEATQQMRQVAAQTGSRFDPADKPIVLIVTSMAGGAGASMALDVCRMLAQLPDHDPRLTALFLASPDIFDVLPPAARSGVRANGLAMLGEIVASQTGAARDHDDAVLAGVGVSSGQSAEVPFARVFPVGRHVGSRRTLFGDGTQLSVYRGLARGLAGVISSDTATNQFVSYDLGNTGSVTPNLDPLGWGADPADPLPWGSFGFASLSMGRDRYAEYAAQRIARRSVDQLLDGHLQPGDPSSGTEQVAGLLDSQWSALCAATGLPDATGQNLQSAVGSWITSTVLPRRDAEATAGRIVQQDFSSQLSSPEGQQAQQWLDLAQRRLSAQAPVITESINAEAARWVYDWHPKLITAVEDAVAAAIARHGLAYAGGLVDRLGSHLRNVVIEGADGLARVDGGDLARLPEAVTGRLAAVKGAITGGGAVVDQIVDDSGDGLKKKVRTHYYRKVSELVAETVKSFSSDVLPSLGQAIRTRQAELEDARSAPVRLDGLALLKTDQYAAWPADTVATDVAQPEDLTRVPRRFDEADNEVLLTPSTHFPIQFDRDRRSAVPAEPTATGSADTGPIVIGGDPARTVAAQVISGVWATTGGVRPPADLLERTAEWRPRAFATSPVTGEPIVPGQARYDLHLRRPEILRRARSFVARPEESFDRFVSVSLRDHITATDTTALERDRRRTEMVQKFTETLRLAMPLISVNEQIVRLLHGGDGVQYRYKFSDVPFADLDLAAELERELVTDAAIDQSTRDNFRDALADQGDPRRIDVFGSYPLLSPLTFDAVLRPIAEQWSSTSPHGRTAFWNLRRARPLTAALPMAAAERRAMVAGWYIGQIIGELRIPEPPYTTPVEIYDRDADRWVGFPSPLLTSPQQFLAPYDWLPAVLESVLIAIAGANDAPVLSSLRPYQLLRGLYDANSGGPAAGITPLSGRGLLASWIQHGSRPGRESRIASLAQAGTADERRARAQEWLTGEKGPGGLAGTHFMPAGQDGAPGGGTFSEIDSREKAASAPIFGDLAPDIFWATRRIAELLDEADSAEPDGQQPAHRIEMPEGEVF